MRTLTFSHLPKALVCFCVRIYALVQSCKSIGVRPRAHIFQSSESIGGLARVLLKLRTRARTKSCAHMCVRVLTISNLPKALLCLCARIYAIVQSCKTIGVRARTHIFQSSESIGVLARASTYQIKRAYLRLSNYAKALVYVRAHTFSNLPKALVCLRALVCPKKSSGAQVPNHARICVSARTHFPIF